MSLSLATEGIIARRVIAGEPIAELQFGKIYFRGEELKPEIKVAVILSIGIRKE